MLFRQFLDDDLGCASYLIGDEEAGVAVVVDPLFSSDDLLRAVERHEVRLIRSLLTHTHADHLSGHGRLALEQGVPVSIHPAAEAEYPHEPLEDGTEIEVGQVLLRVLHTPGHRPEHVCFAVTDRSRGSTPWLVLTGDSLFVGDAARPDLAVGARQGAEDLFRSLQRLLELADGIEVFPGHVAGSLCGRAMSSKASSTIGYERLFNPALQIGSEGQFVTDAVGAATPKPPNMSRIVELNRGPFVGQPRAVAELAAPTASTLLDVRPVGDYLEGHRAGALNVPVSGSSFATKAAFVLDPDESVVVQAASPEETERAIKGLWSVGVLDLDGYVLGGGSEQMEAVSLDELEELLSGGAELIDVRERDERDTGYIAGSRNIPYRLLSACGPDVTADRAVVTICESGERAGVAASILAAQGIDARPVLDGGVSAWAARGGHTVEFRRCGN